MMMKKEIKSSTNNIGLLAVEGDATMKGYYNAPELTQEIKKWTNYLYKGYGLYR